MCKCNVANNLFGVESVEKASPPMQFKPAVIADKVATPTTQQLVDQAFAEIGNYDNNEAWIQKSKEAYQNYQDENFAWEWLLRRYYAIIGNYTDVNKWAIAREEIRPKFNDAVANAFWNYYQGKLQIILSNNTSSPGTNTQTYTDEAASKGMSTAAKVGLTVVGIGGVAYLFKSFFGSSSKSHLSGIKEQKMAKNGKKRQRGANGQFKKVQKISY